ncbi:hypothetical protein QRQ56_26690 [Bradyrhizobium sp. U531]
MRLWQVELQTGGELKLPITVCHLPRGTIKWNKIEHRLFSFITITGGESHRVAIARSSS